VRSIMEAQWPRWRRLQAATDVVWNGGSEEGLGPQCERLHALYRVVNAAPLPHNPGQPRAGP